MDIFPECQIQSITDKIVLIKITWPKRPFSNFSFFERQKWQYIPTYLKISCWYDYYKSHVVWQSVNKIQTTLQITDQAVTKKWLVKTKLVILKFIP